MQISTGLSDTMRSLAQTAMRCNACFDDGKLLRSFVDLPQPRYIGPAYWTSSPRIAWVMINPGAGCDTPRERSWRGSLVNYRDGTGSLQAVFDEQRKHMPSWNDMLPFIARHGLDVDALALVNVAWCASAGNKYPVRMLDTCWDRHSDPWLQDLAPAVVILSGTRTYRYQAQIRALLPTAQVLTTFHYAHRPLDATRANARAEEIRQELGR